MRKSHADCDHPSTNSARHRCNLGSQEAIQQYYKNLRYKRSFGGSLELFEQKWEAQKGLCAICGIEMLRDKSRSWRVACFDHCHEQLKPRGLLCRRCNINVGWFERFAKPILKYLEKYK